ncbi:MAG: hypothetical protein FWD03_09205 [Defluviitaleaceae bacterium]|nr:hypothetical protein [Defluviitaleaceae bacterium]
MMNPSDKARRLLMCLGNIEDAFLEEVELLSSIKPSVAIYKTRKRVVQYSALAAAASVGIAVTYFVIKAKRTSAIGNVVSA